MASVLAVLIPLIYIAVTLAVAYVVIRAAVKGGILDAQRHNERRRQAEAARSQA